MKVSEGPTEDEMDALMEEEAALEGQEIQEVRKWRHPNPVNPPPAEVLEMEKATEIQAEPLTEPEIQRDGELPKEAKIIQLPQTPTTEQGNSTTIDPLPQETTNSSPELPEPESQDPQYTKFVEHVLLNLTESYVAAHLGMVVANPQVIPRIPLWKPSARLNIPQLILTLINQPGYLEKNFEVLRIIMGDSFHNTAWAANILITLAFFDVIKLLPFAEHIPSAKQ